MQMLKYIFNNPYGKNLLRPKCIFLYIQWCTQNIFPKWKIYFGLTLIYQKKNVLPSFVSRVCVCVCVCVCAHVYVVYEDTNLYNDLGMT